jgi:hypothetical protein
MSGYRRSPWIRKILFKAAPPISIDTGRQATSMTACGIFGTVTLTQVRIRVTVPYLRGLRWCIGRSLIVSSQPRSEAEANFC